MKHALIIEDNADNLVLITRLLKNAGYRTTSATDGRSGYDAAVAALPDFILLDIQLPDMHGTEVLRMLRETPETKDITIIAVTSYAMSGDREDLLKQGCDGYIEKPIDPDQIIQQIEEIVGQPGRTILIVDDDDDSRTYLARAVQSSGHNVVAASDGLEALEAARASRPDMIISDVLMPHMDGFQLCRKVKEDADLRNIPVLFYTATYTDQGDMELAHALGASRYLLKPLEAPELRRHIAQVFIETEGGIPIPALSEHDQLEIGDLNIRVLAKKLDRKVQALQEALDESEKAREQLSISQERLDQAAQLARLGHCVWDPAEDRCVYCSDEFARIHGMPPAEYVARSSQLDTDWIHPEDKEAYRSAVQALHGGEGFEMDYRIVTPTDQIKHVRGIAKPVFDKAGHVVQEICTIQDVTETKAMEERFRQAAKMEAVGQLTSGIAHDFNNMLTVIQANTEFLRSEVGKENPMIDAILRTTDRASKLTSSLLAFTRQQPLDPRAQELAVLVSSMSDLLDRTLGAHIEVRTILPSNLWFALADPGQLENALLNLAVNARDAMPDGGTLTIECSNQKIEGRAARDLEVEPGNYVRVVVRDSGEGMSAEVRSHAFEPFFTTKDIGKGSGLGLSMVFGFAQQSGGAAVIESVEGSGTSVALYLPEAEGQPDDIVARSSRGRPVGRGEKLLVIEDNEEVRKPALKMLESLGYRAIGANDAAEAEAILENEHDIDLVLSDVVLPGGMSGFAFAEEACRRDPTLKVVFMSGNPTHAGALDHQVSSDDMLLQKPFGQDELAEFVRDALKK